MDRQALAAALLSIVFFVAAFSTTSKYFLTPAVLGDEMFYYTSSIFLAHEYGLPCGIDIEYGSREYNISINIGGSFPGAFIYISPVQNPEHPGLAKLIYMPFACFSSIVTLRFFILSFNLAALFAFYYVFARRVGVYNAIAAALLSAILSYNYRYMMWLVYLDSVMIPFLLLSLAAALSGKYRLSALFYGFSVASKEYALIFLPAYLASIPDKKHKLMYLAAGVAGLYAGWTIVAPSIYYNPLNIAKSLKSLSGIGSVNSLPLLLWRPVSIFGVFASTVFVHVPLFILLAVFSSKSRSPLIETFAMLGISIPYLLNIFRPTYPYYFSVVEPVAGAAVVMAIQSYRFGAGESAG